jgi:hypothetical protein
MAHSPDIAMPERRLVKRTTVEWSEDRAVETKEAYSRAFIWT